MKQLVTICAGLLGEVLEEHVVLPSSQPLESEDPGAEINPSFTTHLLGEMGHNF